MKITIEFDGKIPPKIVEAIRKEKIVYLPDLLKEINSDYEGLQFHFIYIKAATDGNNIEYLHTKSTIALTIQSYTG